MMMMILILTRVLTTITLFTSHLVRTPPVSTHPTISYYLCYILTMELRKVSRVEDLRSMARVKRQKRVHAMWQTPAAPASPFFHFRKKKTDLVLNFSQVSFIRNSLRDIREQLAPSTSTTHLFLTSSKCGLMSGMSGIKNWIEIEGIMYLCIGR